MTFRTEHFPMAALSLSIGPVPRNGPAETRRIRPAARGSRVGTLL